MLAELVGVHEYLPVCEVCLKHLSDRAEDEPIPANWNDVHRRYVAAVREYPEPVFPSVEAVEEAEAHDPKGTAKLMLAATNI